jgi:hypothetical protein
VILWTGAEIAEESTKDTRTPDLRHQWLIFSRPIFSFHLTTIYSPFTSVQHFSHYSRTKPRTTCPVLRQKNHSTICRLFSYPSVSLVSSFASSTSKCNPIIPESVLRCRSYHSRRAISHLLRKSRSSHFSRKQLKYLSLWMTEVFSDIQWIHRLGLVHCDIKPNVKYWLKTVTHLRSAFRICICQDRLNSCLVIVGKNRI